MTARWKLIVYLVAIFAAGSVSGWMVAEKNTAEKAWQKMPRHEDMAERSKAKYRQELQLTEEQAVKVDAIIDENFAKVKDMHGRHMNELSDIINKRNERIMAVLTREQQQTFLQNQARRQAEMSDKFRSKRGHGHRQGGPPREKDGKKCESNKTTEKRDL